MPATEDLTGLLLDGRYRLTRLMGEGGMGQVYEGMHETLDRKVAVKVLLPRYAYEPKFRERFLREAKAASKVRHPNVVQILDFGDTPGGSVYFVMELLEGRDLAALLREEGPLPWPRARHILAQAAAALAAAHELKIIHRDIKPANFFIGDVRGLQDFVKVLDFGIAKLIVDAGNEESSLAQSLTGTGEVFGTAKYMAPEQAYGASNDPRVDVYSLGIVAYELLTGQVPFTGVSAFHIITRHVNERPRPPHELAPGIPAAVEALILRAMAKQPQDRFASMEAMEQALLAIGPGVPEEQPLVHSRPPPPLPPGPPVAIQRVPVPPVASSGPPVGSATSVFPTRLKAPSPVTSGELRGASPAGAPATRGIGAEDSGIGAATARTQGSGDDASGTGPTDARASGSRVPATDPHARYTASRPTVPSRNRGLLLGLLGTLGGCVAVLAGFLVVVSNEEDPEPAGIVQAGASMPAVNGGTPQVDGGSAVAPPSVTPSVSVVPIPTTPTEPTPGPEPKGATEPAPSTPAPVPTAPASKPASKPAPAKAKPAAPLTDAKVESQLVRSLEKKCAALERGVSATVSVVVGRDGRVLSKSVKGASSELGKCLTEGVAKAQFPAGAVRNVAIEVSL